MAFWRSLPEEGWNRSVFLVGLHRFEQSTYSFQSSTILVQAGAQLKQSWALSFVLFYFYTSSGQLALI